jgi:hypothetical protein
VANANEWPAVPYSLHSIFDPPADLPDEMKAVYERAAAPVLIAVSFCSWPERFDFSPEQLSSWAVPLRQSWHGLAEWVRDHEGELRAEAPEVLAACEGILGAVAPLESRLSSLVSMRSPHAGDPTNATLVALVDALRENSARNASRLAHDQLDGITVSAESLAKVRSAICTWAGRQKVANARVQADADRQPAGPLADGTVKDARIWLKGKPYALTQGLRDLLSYLLANPGVSEERVIREFGWSGSSHLHKRLKDL